MRIFYDITTAIKNQLEANEVTKTVTLGDITDVDLNRQTIFPLAHMIPNQATLNGNTVSLDISIIFADLVDYSTEETKAQNDPFFGNNNLQDVLNTQMYVATLLAQELTRGDLWDSYYQVTTSPTLEPFLDRFENNLAGWVMTFSVDVRNTDISIC